MTTEVSSADKQQIESKLYDTLAVQRRVLQLPLPHFIAINSNFTDERAQSRISLEHTAFITQVARSHLYLAHYERLTHHKYTDPPNMLGGDFAAFSLMTSFASHIVAAKNQFVVTLALQFNITYPHKTQGQKIQGDIAKVRTELKAKGEHAYADLLKPLQESTDMTWIERYRHRWTHRDPVRVEGLGMRYSSKREFWRDLGTSREMPLDFDGDKPEVTVDQLLVKGVSAFNLLGKQLDLYTNLWETATNSI